jgi:hypothetical protein
MNYQILQTPLVLIFLLQTAGSDPELSGEEGGICVLWNCYFVMDKMHTVQGWIQQRSGGLDSHTPPPPKPRIFNVYVESGKKKDIELVW